MGSIWYQPIWRLAQQISRSKRFRQIQDKQIMMTCLQTLYGWKTAGLTTYFTIVLGIDHKTASYAKLIKW
jgi:hypothetical protein